MLDAEITQKNKTVPMNFQSMFLSEEILLKSPVAP